MRVVIEMFYYSLTKRFTNTDKSDFVSNITKEDKV